MNPASEPYRLLTLSVDTLKCVGRTPYIVQGWRPYSATYQPSSQAIQGAGNIHRAHLSNQGFCMLADLIVFQKARPNSASIAKAILCYACAIWPDLLEHDYFFFHAKALVAQVGSVD